MSFNFMTAVTVCSDFGAQENKICCCFHFSPCIPSHEVMELDKNTCQNSVCLQYLDITMLTVRVRKLQVQAGSPEQPLPRHMPGWLGWLSAFYWSKQNLGFLPHPIPSHPFWPSPNAQKAHSNLSLKTDFAFSVQLGSERCRSSQLQQWPDGQLPYPLLSPALVL